MTETTPGNRLAEVWAQVAPSPQLLGVEAGRQVAVTATEMVMTERQRRALYPDTVTPGTLAIVRALGDGWKPPILTQIQPILDTARINPLAGVWGSDLVRHAQETALAVAQHARTPLVTPEMLRAVINTAAPHLDISIIIKSPIFTAITEQIARMLRHWADLAATGSPRGRGALADARSARDAYLHDGLWGPVEAFVRTWLGLKWPRRDHVEAALDALLDANLDDPVVRFSWLWDGEVLGTLRTRVIATARYHRPLREGEIAGRRIAMLDDPLRTDEPDRGTLLDVLADKPAPTLLLEAGFDDVRLERAWGQFTAQERAVVVAQGLRGGTWADAGVAAGYSPEVGEAVRRKRAMVARRVIERLEARERP